MVSDPGDLTTGEAEISLCVFPHLNELVVVDGRRELPGRPLFQVMQIGDVFDERFFEGVQADFADLLRRDERPFMKMLALPQELEGLIRLHGLKAIMSQLNEDAEGGDEGEMPSIAVLILTGPFLTLDDAGLRASLREMFEPHLDGARLEDCIDAVAALADQERQSSNGGHPSELTSLIQGDDTYYATIWQNGEESPYE